MKSKAIVTIGIIFIYSVDVPDCDEIQVPCLCISVLIVMELTQSHRLHGVGADDSQTLKSGGQVRVERTTSC